MSRHDLPAGRRGPPPEDSEFFARLAQCRETCMLQIAFLIQSEQCRQDCEDPEIPVPEMAAELRYSPTTIRKYLRLLEQQEFLDREHRRGRPSGNGGRGDRYALALPSRRGASHDQEEQEDAVEEKAAPTRGPTEKRPDDALTSSGRQFWFVCLRQQASHDKPDHSPSVYPKPGVGCKP